METKAMPDVTMLLDKDGYVIKLGQGSSMKAKELKDCIKEGGSIKTVPYSEYEKKEWKWIYDKGK